MARSLAVSWVIVGANGATAVMSNDWVTSVAALWFALEPREAVRVQVPENTIVTELSATVQTAGVELATVTARPDVDVGATENGVVEKLRSAGSAKVIVWSAFVTVIVIVFEVASR